MKDKIIKSENINKIGLLHGKAYLFRNSYYWDNIRKESDNEIKDSKESMYERISDIYNDIKELYNATK